MAGHGKKFKSVKKKFKRNVIDARIRLQEVRKRASAQKRLSDKQKYSIASQDIPVTRRGGSRITGGVTVPHKPVIGIRKRIRGSSTTVQKPKMRRLFGLSTTRKFKKAPRR